MKILINRKPVIGQGWGGGNSFVTHFHNLAPSFEFEVVHKFEPNLDAIFVVDPRMDDLRISYQEVIAYKIANPQTKLIYRVNECDARKGEKDVIDPLVRAVGRYADVSIFISNWLRDVHRTNGWWCRKDTVVINGADRSLFAPQKKISNGKLNLISHHWSDNPMKGSDVYEAVDEWVGRNSDNFTFTYIGRTKNKFVNTTVIPATFGKDLADRLGSYDAYISGSRFDPGPNHIAESLSCELPTWVHKDGGGAVEMAGSDHVYRDIPHLLEILESLEITRPNFPDDLFGIVGNRRPPSRVEDWSLCIGRYFDIVRKSLRGE